MNETGIPEGWVQINGEWFHPSRLGRLRPIDAKQAKGTALVGPVPREEKGLLGYGVRFTVYSTRPADADAYHIKELLDMVVHAGIIPDDNFQVVTECSLRSRQVKTKAEERTEIEITPNP